MSETIVIIEDVPSQLRGAQPQLRLALQFVAVDCRGGNGIPDGLLQHVKNVSLIIFDFETLSQEHLYLMAELRAAWPQLPQIVLLPLGQEWQYQRLVDMGMTDVLVKPLELTRLRISVGNALKVQRMSQLIARLERATAMHVHFGELVGNHPDFVLAKQKAQDMARNDRPVFIEGVEGAGKTLLAQAIHGQSERGGRAFVVMDCRRVEEREAEALLFGSEGEFAGKIDAAQNGTLYLREIGALSVALHHRLHDTLQSGQWRGRPMNLRVICSSSAPLEPQVRDGKFSLALYRWLHAEPIALPPLEARRADIPALAHHFLTMHSAREGKYISRLSDDALESLCAQEWPGNVAQLSALVQRCCLLAAHDMIDAGTLRLVQQLESVHYPSRQVQMEDVPSCVDRQGRVKKLKSIEEEVIHFALKSSGGCMTKAARSLGIGRSTLYRRVLSGDAKAHKILANQTTRPKMRMSSSDFS
ncbi:MAG: sigma-54-dependent Fis family transcriptional regulator [Proteobacteria bacterium]|nr:sigma-54-dependent Fis family transcriptional regulator [Pseudomonadota bacterium]